MKMKEKKDLAIVFIFLLLASLFIIGAGCQRKDIQCNLSNCEGKPQPDCVGGHWQVSGTRPDCNCSYRCQGSQNQTQSPEINPYDSAQEIECGDSIPNATNADIKPILIDLFGGAKLIICRTDELSLTPGAYLHQLLYTVKRKIVLSDGASIKEQLILKGYHESAMGLEKEFFGVTYLVLVGPITDSQTVHIQVKAI